MKKFMNWLSESFAPAADKLFSGPWLSGISGAMQKVIPFILTGSVIFFYNVFRDFLPMLPDLSPIISYSFGLLTLYLTFMVTNQLMEKLGQNDYSINSALLAIGVLIMVAKPTSDGPEAMSIFLGNLGPTSMGVGLVVGIFVATIFNFWGKINFLKESSVPDFMVHWINAIIPSLITLLVSAYLVIGLKIDILGSVLSVFKPIVGISQTLPGFILLCFIPVFFYSLGLSSWMFSAITTPIFLAGIQENVELVSKGLAATNIVSSESVYTLGFITMGGMGATLALNLLMVFSRSRELKTMGKVFIAPSIFNINEPIVYGAVAYNPLLMVPMWISSIVGPIYVWVLMQSGLLNIPSKVIQMAQIPAPVSSVVITGDIRAIVWWVILLMIYLMIWYPFFKSYEKIKIKDEKSEDI